MSSIFGIFNRDGTTPDPGAIEAMRKAHEYWAPDAEGVWSEGPVALGHCMLWNTPESHLEDQPTVAHEGDAAMVITADTRLDNRGELAEIFSLDSAELARTSDVDLLMMAWQKWGESCPEHLLGDFVFVIWDSRSQSLFCVRDHVGIRHFYYYLTDQIFAFSSDIRVLITLQQIPRDLDPKAVAIYLTEGELLSPDLTFLKAVKKFPAASFLTLTCSELKRHSYWRAEDAPALEFDSVEDSVTALHKLLELVVSDRLRTDYPVFSHLSGGLDSSAISVIAARQLAQKNLKLFSFNWVPKPGPEEDPDDYEWANAVKVAEQEGIELDNVELNTTDVVEDLRETDISLSCNLDFWYEPPIRKAIQQAGGRVILSGWGGDELISHQGYVVHGDLFWHGCFTTAIRGMLAEARNSERPFRRFISLTLHDILVPALPASLRNRIDPQHYSYADYLQCAQPEFAAFVKQQDFKPWSRPVLNNRAVQLGLFNLGNIQTRVECFTDSAWEARVEYRYPLLDKRIIEFALGLPAEYFRQNGIARFVFSEVCKDLLPDGIHSHKKIAESKRIERMLIHELDALNILFEELHLDAATGQNLFNEQFVSMEKIFSFQNTVNSIPESKLHERIDAADILIKSLRVIRLGTKIVP